MDKEFLNGVGKIWTKKELKSDVIMTPQLEEQVNAIHSFLTKADPRSVLITGDKGVGKSTIIQQVAKKLSSEKWVIFSATAANLMAGQRYIGDLELRVQRVVDHLTSKKKVLWIVPRFHELYYGGRHEYSPVSILDHLFAPIENGNLKIISEVDPLSLEKITQNRPQISSVFETVRVEDLDKETMLVLAQKWMRTGEDKVGIWSKFKPEDILESYTLAGQYLSFKENPGRLMDLLKQTQSLVEADKNGEREINIGDIFSTISNITGLPNTILNDQERLDLESLKTHFSNKVIGQNDAVTTIVERIAMIKAGLTDPNKPAGVFLFVGPTGTGKTEIAKAFAEYLFGSPDRLVRLDMSEFQTYESVSKIFGDVSDISENTALVNIIRRKPFSVVLLDEFEKAHPNIWDIFLQVFDDGRLTDQKGSLADFRHSIIILTSNIGASVPSSKNVGFKHVDQTDMDSNVMKSIHQTFRPEFVNRIDKIVVFNPLTKAVAKTILKKELKKILERRGLRQREWELDFEESAIDFLLEKGFSSAFGARPLKRAIEKYLLAPLAITIVNHNFPSGNQFLMVSATKQKLKVQFIDPDEPDYTWEQKKGLMAKADVKSETLALSTILLDCKGVLAEFKVIKRELEDLHAQIATHELSESKEDLLAEMSTNEFWSSEDRYEVLAEIEYLDRFASVVETVDRLFERLHNPEKERLSYDVKLIKKLTQKIYLLKRSLSSYVEGETQDAIYSVSYKKENEVYGQKIRNMYVSWAKSRGMKLKKIEETHEDQEVQFIATCSGFGAYDILKSETGYHVFEELIPNKDISVKSRIKVKVIPMDIENYRSEDLEKIKESFRAIGGSNNARRYKIDKSPVVKDLVKGWKTGKIQQVLAGNFDLFA